MFEAEFTHDGDLCTFEVLVSRLRLDDRALLPIAEIVHDIDLKETKFDRPEAIGIDRLIAGIAMAPSGRRVPTPAWVRRVRRPVRVLQPKTSLSHMRPPFTADRTPMNQGR